jgi:hypothetical protein
LTGAAGSADLPTAFKKLSWDDPAPVDESLTTFMGANPARK